MCSSLKWPLTCRWRKRLSISVSVCLPNCLWAKHLSLSMAVLARVSYFRTLFRVFRIHFYTTLASTLLPLCCVNDLKGYSFGGSAYTISNYFVTHRHTYVGLNAHKNSRKESFLQLKYWIKLIILYPTIFIYKSLREKNFKVERGEVSNYYIFTIILF